jgi:hypothetical protein
MGLRRCSHCGDSFCSVDSDSTLPQKFCSEWCEFDWVDGLLERQSASFTQEGEYDESY